MSVLLGQSMLLLRYLCTKKEKMEVGDRFFWILLVGIWTIFILWELQIQIMTESLLSQIVRYDLLILPILLLVTGYALYENRKNRK